MHEPITVDTARVTLHGVVHYALNKLSGYTSKPTLSLLGEYVQSLYRPADTGKEQIPFRLSDLEEILILCLESSPFFNQNTLKVDQLFQGSFIVGNRLSIMSDILVVLTYVGAIQQNGVIGLHIDYDPKGRELLVELKGSALNQSQLGCIRKALLGEELKLTKDHELAISFPCSVIGYQEDSRESKCLPPKEKFAYLYQIAGDIPGMVQKIIQAIVDVIPGEIQQMKDALQAHHFTTVGEVAHKVKANFRSIGEEDLALLLEKIEVVSESDDISQVHELIDEFTARAEEIIQELGAYVD